MFRDGIQWKRGVHPPGIVGERGGPSSRPRKGPHPERRAQIEKFEGASQSHCNRGRAARVRASRALMET
jgi:hypothetical protein